MSVSTKRVIYGTSSNDWIIGTEGHDEIYGLAGSDEIVGGLGDDYIDGGVGHDFLNGGAGNDILVGTDGVDSLNGEDGDDLLAVSWTNEYNYEGSWRIAGGEGYDTLSIVSYQPSGSSAQWFEEPGPAPGNPVIVLSAENSIERVIGSQGNDIINVYANFDVHLDGGAGNDTLEAGDGNDVLVGGDGDDVVWGGSGADVVYGGAGNDRVRGYDNDRVYGGDGDDYLIGDSAGPSSGAGSSLWGGAGNDTFEFGTYGVRTAMDFEGAGAVGGDIVMVVYGNRDYVNFEYLMANNAHQVGNDTHLVLDNSTLILAGVAKQTLVADDFLFVPY
ncbi:MAG TPA: calcium-binding protein [Azospirillaceae bacterium]|nr:calcium-binding protein [Azospirillaceae bacterium]